MRLVRYFLMLLVIASVIALPSHGHVLSHPGDSGHHIYAQAGHDAAEFAPATTLKSPQALAVAFAGSDPDCHDVFHHGDTCCCMSCVPNFTLPHVIGLQVRLMSQRLTLRSPHADPWRTGALLGLALRPPIFG